MMKKFFTLFLATLLMVSVAVLSVNATVKFDAADVTYVTADEYDDSDFGDLVYEATGNQDEIGGYVGEIGSTIYNLSSGGTGFCVKTDAYVWYDFEVAADGTYTFSLEYVAREGTPRGINVVIDPSSMAQSEQTFLLLDPCADNNDHHIGSFAVDLTAGKHQIYICMATGFDDSALKSCDFYGVQVYFTAPAPEPVVEETVAEVVDTPVETVVVAPQTADALVGAMMAVVVSAAAVGILKKKH